MVPTVHPATRPAIGIQLSLTQILVAEAAPVTIEPPALIVTPAATIPLPIVENAMTATIPEARVSGRHICRISKLIHTVK